MTTPIGPDFIALQVRSLATSGKFYMEVFGFEAAAQIRLARSFSRPRRSRWRCESLSVRFPKRGRSVWAWCSGSRATTPTRCTT